MRNPLAAGLAFACFAYPAFAQEDMRALREEIAQLRKAYEERIAMLEARLRAAEEKGMARKAPEPASPAAASAFNPNVSLILDGVYFHDNRGGRSASLYASIDGAHHAHDEHARALERGFDLRTTELVLSAAVSPHFDAAAKLGIERKGEVTLEEAYFETRSLPAGFKLRAGKFLSGIGYLNAQHPHQWDFVDQNLPYQTLLGEHGLTDTGLRVVWTPKTGSWYTQFGVEWLQGQEQAFATSGLTTPNARADGQPLAPTAAGQLSAQKGGPRLWTLYAKFAPDLGTRHALQWGGWLARARQHQEVHDHTAEDPASLVHALEGKARAWGLDAVYRYDADGYGGQGNLKFVAEYLRVSKDLRIAFHEDGALLGQPRDFVQDGAVIQATYGVLPYWRIGLRYDALGLTKNEVRGPSGRLQEWRRSDRWTWALTREIDHFSRLRLQLSRAHLWVDGVREKANQLFLQYQLSLGAHGAHAF
ncbi:MAG: hypothetical protein N2441_00625 [Rhodocyclaceae bacterium]|nr:hypothetical protein [Rhodocyclaceae bacterium]